MKTTWKIMHGVLFGMLLAAAVFLLPRTVLAAEETLTLALDAEAASAVEGADLAVKVNFAGTSVGAISGELAYECGKVNFISAESSGAEGTAFSAADDGEKVRFVWGDAAEAEDGGEIAAFYFSLDDRADLVSFSLNDETLTACRAEDGTVAYFDLTETEELTEAVNVGASYEVDNKHDQYYTTYAYPVTANLIAVDGGYVTVDKTKDTAGNARLLVKTYDSAYKLTGSRYIDSELPLYGGFYASDDAYYYLSGQKNADEDDSVEVFRITKYDTSWNRLGSASLYGANTYIPFDAGSARFAEYGNYLFVRTCHEMYKTSDGYHHQANVTMKVDTSSMTVLSSFTGVSNIGTGYVSHSFNQFIAVDDDGYVAALDHGDAYTRAAVLGRYGKKADSVVFGTGASYTHSETMAYYGEDGDNTTNASVGGLAFSEDNYLTAGNSNPQDGSTVKVRNVYVSVNPRSGFPGTPTVTWLSNYAASGTTTASTPHLTKIDDDTFLVLWEEFTLGGWYTTETLNCRYAFLDGDGNVTSSGSFKGYLSDCDPIVVGGKAVWYVTNDDMTDFFVLGQDGTLSIRGDLVEITSVENESSGVRLTWSRDLYSGYLNVYRRDNTIYTSDAHTDWELLGTVSANSYLDETAVTGHGYYYTVRPATYDGENLPKAWDDVGTYIVRVPAPELTSVTATAEGPKISWNTTSDGSNVTAYMSNDYVVWRKTEGSDWAEIGTAGNENSAYAFTWDYTDTTAEAGKTYSYTVSARMTRMGETFEGPKDETGLLAVILKQPVVTELSAESTGVNLSWNAISGAESYRVYRMSRSVLEFVKEKESQGITADVEWTVAGATAGTSLKDTGVSCGEWYYIVQAVSGSYESAKDFELSDPHIVFVPEVDINTYGYSSQKAAVYLNWVWSSNYSGYAVYRRTDESEWSLVGTIEGTSAVTYYDEEPLFGTVTEYTVTAFYEDYDGVSHEGFKTEPGVTVDLNKMRFYEVSAEESTYTGEAVTPSFKVVNADDGSELSSAYYTAEFSNNVNIGTGTITVTGKGEYSGTITGTFVINPKAVEASMIGEITEQTYSGSSLKPVITVRDGSEMLVEGTDYAVIYGENIYPPTGTVTITGTGYYTGNAERSFTIRPKAITASMVVAIVEQTYSGSTIKPEIIVMDGSKTLEEGTDYTVSYGENVYPPTGTVTITGTNNYMGIVEKVFIIKPKAVSNSMIQEIVDQMYTGSPLKPEIRVKDGSRTLTEGTDYTVSYGENIYPSTGTVTITGIGCYRGNAEKAFTITPKVITASMIGAIGEQTYSGNSYTPIITVKDGSEILVEGVDYTVSYGENIHPPIGTVIITGTGYYTGNVESTFLIKPKTVIATMIESIGEQTYGGSPLKPVITVMDGYKTLVEGTDYTVSYGENVYPPTGTVIITGTNNYIGTVEKDFIINPKAVEASMIGEITEQTYNGSQIKPAITVKDGSKTLAEGTDYTVSYGENIYPETGTVTITGTGNYMGTAEKSFVIDGGPILSISLSESNITLVYGKSRAVPAVTYEPDFTSDEKTVIWSSSDTKIAKVVSGRITAVNPGNAVLTASVPGRDVSASLNVRVLFKDVTDANLWYFDSVYWALEKNVTSGMGAGTFQPLADLSRAQTVMFLYKLAGQPDVSGLTVQEFEDVSANAWYHDAVKWAVANEITTGYGSGTFRPDLTCNRAMIVTFLMRYSKYAGTYKAPTAAATFMDVAAGAWYEEAVNWAVESGVTTGYGEGTFQPMRTCNRAMMVTFLKRAAELPKA